MEEHIESEFKVKRGNSLRGKPWVVSTFVLGILVVLLLLGSLTGMTGHSISGTKAGDNLVNFAISQGVAAKFVNVTSDGSFYRVFITIDNQTVPYLITKDGKYFLSESYLVPLTTVDTANTNTNTNTQTQPQNIPKSAKPAVELFVMSYCPYGTQSEKGILPVVDLLGSKIDFNIRFVYYSMHPTQGEVEENLRQYCIQKEQKTKFNDYLTCFLQAGDSASCLTQVAIDKTKLNACTAATDKTFQITANKDDKSKWLNGNYPLFNIDKTLNEQYGIAGSPTLVINGVQATSARDSASYLDVICQAFTDGNVPTECGTKLSSTAPSPGFGSGAASSTTAAQCA